MFLNAAILGMGRREIAARFDEIVEFSGLESFIDSPVKTYSTGMYVRLAFAVAINVDPQLLIIDEILAVGDVTFQQKCMEKFVDFRNEGRTIVLVTHAMNSVRDMCDRAVWLEHGRLIDEGDPAELVEAYTERMLGEPRSAASTAASVEAPARSRSNGSRCSSGGNETPVKRFRTGDDVRLRLHWTAPRSRCRSRCSASRSRASAVRSITSPCTRDVGLLPESLCRARASSTSTLTDVPLLPGTYDLHTVDHRLQPPARVRPPPGRAAVRRDDRPHPRNRRRGDPAPGVDPPLSRAAGRAGRRVSGCGTVGGGSPSVVRVRWNSGRRAASDDARPRRRPAGPTACGWTRSTPSTSTVP